MKKKIVSMALMVVLCFVLAMSAFAEGVQYKIGDYVAYSGHTDFGYYFTYSVRFLYKGIIINHNKNRANLH